MSVNSIDMQNLLMTPDEVLSPVVDESLSAGEELCPSELAAAPEFSSPPGLSLPTEVKEVTPEMQQLIDHVSLELTRRAESFASSHLMTEDDSFDFEYLTTMLPPGLDPPPGLEDYSEDSAGATAKMDGNESSDESTKADSQPDESTKADSGSATASSDEEDELYDEVSDLPDLSSEALSLKKQEKKQAKKNANAAANTTNATTRIVFGDQGAKLAKQAAQAGKLAESSGYAGVMSWQPPPGAVAYGWHPYYGYVAW